jgi:hypothetical protein
MPPPCRRTYGKEIICAAFVVGLLLVGLTMDVHTEGSDLRLSSLRNPFTYEEEQQVAAEETAKATTDSKIGPLASVLRLRELNALGFPVSYRSDDSVNRGPIPAEGQCFPYASTSGGLGGDDSNRLNALPHIDIEALKQGEVSNVHIATEIYMLNHSWGTDKHLASRANMMERSRKRYCGDRGNFRPEFLPTGGCGDQLDMVNEVEPMFDWPWCRSPRESIFVVTVECALVENFAKCDCIAQTPVTENFILSSNVGQYRFDAGRSFVEFDELAIPGTVVYVQAPGHFANEILPSLLVLDSVLPVHIPLAWPAGGFPQVLYDELRAAGVINPNRTIAWLGMPASVWRVKRLHMMKPDRTAEFAPYIAWYPQRLTSMHLTTVLEKKLMEQHGSNILETIRKERMHNVVILRRDGVRSIANEQEFMDTIRSVLGSEFSITAFVPNAADGQFWPTAEKVYRGGLIIGPHGANMHNTLFMKTGEPSWVVEIGFVGGMQFPSDWYCLPRNLGFKYYLSIASDGSYSSALTANIEDVREILVAYKAHVAALQH